MESDKIMKVVEDALWHLCFIIYAIESDNDIAIQAVLNHS